MTNYKHCPECQSVNLLIEDEDLEYCKVYLLCCECGFHFFEVLE